MRCVIIALPARAEGMFWRKFFGRFGDGSSSINLIRLNFRSINSQIWDLFGFAVWAGTFFVLILKEHFCLNKSCMLEILAKVYFIGKKWNSFRHFFLDFFSSIEFTHYLRKKARKNIFTLLVNFSQINYLFNLRKNENRLFEKILKKYYHPAGKLQPYAPLLNMKFNSQFTKLWISASDQPENNLPSLVFISVRKDYSMWIHYTRQRASFFCRKCKSWHEQKYCVCTEIGSEWWKSWFKRAEKAKWDWEAA